MFTHSTELYDAIYQQFKDYADESRRVAALLRRVHPNAHTVLDVACGTGEHARHLTGEHGYRVDGIDVEPEFVRIAQQKNPSGHFSRADMTDFELHTEYDAVLCLFSSIGYARTLENVQRSLTRMREHLATGGVVIVEPWFEPGAWRTGTVSMHIAKTDAAKVCRMSYASRVDRMSVIEFHYLVGSAGGIEHRKEIHELGLFSREELETCLGAAGLAVVEYDPKGLIGRGLFVCRAAGGHEELR